MKYERDPGDAQTVHLMCACTRSDGSHLHGNSLEGVVGTFPRLPTIDDALMRDATFGCVHAGGVRRVASSVPESSEIMLSAVFIPHVLIFVKRGELHIVMFHQTVPYK